MLFGIWHFISCEAGCSAIYQHYCKRGQMQLIIVYSSCLWTIHLHNLMQLKIHYLSAKAYHLDVCVCDAVNFFIFAMHCENIISKLQ